MRECHADFVGGCFVYSCNMPAAVERLGKIRVRSLNFVACLTGHTWNLYLDVSLISHCAHFFHSLGTVAGSKTG
jgi:hypothetical protein